MRTVASRVAGLVIALALAGCGTAASAAGDEHEHEPEHAHDHAETGVAWHLAERPELAIAVVGNATEGFVLEVDAPEYTFTGADVHEFTPGQGHAHLAVDGVQLTMIYRPTYRLPILEPGSHELTVTLATNDHREYLFDGEPIRASTIVEIP